MLQAEEEAANLDAMSQVLESLAEDAAAADDDENAAAFEAQQSTDDNNGNKTSSRCLGVCRCFIMLSASDPRSRSSVHRVS